MHAICTSESQLVSQTLRGAKMQQESIRWNPLASESPWKFKDVTWEELLVATDYYGMTDLRTRCEQAVTDGINQNNALQMLFTIGCSFEKVKESALDYLVKNMATLVVDGSDPFEPYERHPKCHSFMLELMRRKAKRA
ncbi:hypothetical protein BGZ54_003695 [Gamsiella multidivaricata]|nr:hypothetical protein BGZ54_003695 [Gamsiella multidivaricata]